SVAFQMLIKAFAQQVSGIAFVYPQPAEFLVVDDEPADVAPEQAHQRAVGVWLFVRVLVMAAVYGHPTGRRILQAAESKDRKRMFQPFCAPEPAVRQQAMVAKIDAKDAKNIIAQYG